MPTRNSYSCCYSYTTKPNAPNPQTKQIQCNKVISQSPYGQRPAHTIIAPSKTDLRSIALRACIVHVHVCYNSNWTSLSAMEKNLRHLTEYTYEMPPLCSVDDKIFIARLIPGTSKMLGMLSLFLLRNPSAIKSSKLKHKLQQLQVQIRLQHKHQSAV